MARTIVKVRVPIPDLADAGDGVQIYTDFGTGTIDFTKPLLARPFPLLPQYRRSLGLGSVPIGFGKVAKERPSPRGAGGGVGTEIVGRTPVGYGREVLDVSVLIPPAYGTHKFAARVIDDEGHAQSISPEVTVMIASTEPAGLKSFLFSGMFGGRARFSFERNAEA